jgi:hypothetical protein
MVKTVTKTESDSRSDAIRLRLHPDIMARLEVASRAYGMPVSTYAAFAIAQSLETFDNNRTMASNAYASMSNKIAEAYTSDKFLDKILEVGLAVAREEHLELPKSPK